MQIIEGVASFKRFSCYDKSAFPFMETGHSIILHFLSKMKEIVIRTGTNVILIPATSVSLPSELETAVKEKATVLQSPSTAELVTVERYK